MKIHAKVGALAMGAMLGVAGIAVPAAANSSSSEVTATVPGGGTTQIQLAGIGVLSVTIDAAGLITDAQLAVDAGVTAAAPVVTPDGVQIAVTLADGTQQTVLGVG